MIDEERRWSLMRHHTGTHLLLHAAKEVLGTHVHQAGAQKGSESARLDIRHFRHITPEELAKIEVVANRMVMADLPVYIRWEERARAEQKYGFDLYQGGVPPGQEIRVVQVDGEVQACAGTHCRSSGEVGAIKVIRVEHIQDGVERIEFAAGIAAIYYMQRIEGILGEAAAAVAVQPENLPPTVQRFFNEWKERGKEIERLQKELSIAKRDRLMDAAVRIGGVPVVVHHVQGASRKELVQLGTELAAQGAAAVITGSENGKNVSIVAASGDARIDAVAVGSEVWTALGGKGGGNPKLAQGTGSDPAQLPAVGDRVRKKVEELLHG
jgi:alanyl-tRNA synthetase